VTGHRPSPAVVCVIGTKNSGKTALTVALVAELSRRGHRVMSAKHGHGFRLDTPGTDSWKHRHDGGAARVALVGPEDMAVVGDWGHEGEPPLADVVSRFLWDADVVIAEGFKTTSYPKIEVFRSASGDGPLMQGGSAHSAPPGTHASSRAAGPFLALVTDRTELAVDVPVLDVSAPETIGRLADRIEELLR
jgi:molybdopterin-guanine dinucleotide biosynthesis protein B